MNRYLYGSLLVFLLIAVAPAAHASSRAQREHGAALFNTNGCLHCHTMGSQGGNRGPNLSDAGRKFKPQDMRKQLEEGGKGMPAFREIIEPKDLDDLVAYLRSCKANTKK
jgi:ubiquinol-cytochrome c reductase cytochrome b subunit